MDAPVLPLWRKLTYAAILSSVAAMACFALFEGALRLSGFGESPHFARLTELESGEKIWRENRSCTVPFFGRDLARKPHPFRLPLKKAPGTYRIFVLGSSAAMGDPEPSFSLARMLETLLRAAYPELKFEVVNAGITAINSHLLRSYAEDCAQLEPDLFIVYEGNNEVIGPFGPSGVFAPFLKSERAIRLAVWLKGTRTGQWLNRTARLLAGQHGTPTEWGGMKMFLGQQLAEDDGRLEAVRSHFAANLKAIREAARRAGASTFFCTVLTNQRDFAPFLSQHRRDLQPAELARWNAYFGAMQQAERSGDSAAAELAARAALAIDDRHAELQYHLGSLLLASGRDVEAKTHLQRALDLDTLRFRTDSRLNELIRGLITQDDVIDLAARLAARSPHGLPGDDLLYEHVHLTLRGTYEAACELLPALGGDLVRRGMIKETKIVPLSYDEVKQRLGYTTYEQTMIALNLLGRFKGAPFNGQSDNAQRISAWERRTAAGNALLSRDDAVPALREIYRLALEKAPDDWLLARNAGAMFVARRLPSEALPLLQRAYAWIDDDIDTLLPLGLALDALGRTPEAELVFAKARNLEPNYPGLPQPAKKQP